MKYVRHSIMVNEPTGINAVCFLLLNARFPDVNGKWKTVHKM